MSNTPGAEEPNEDYEENAELREDDIGVRDEHWVADEEAAEESGDGSDPFREAELDG